MPLPWGYSALTAPDQASVLTTTAAFRVSGRIYKSVCLSVYLFVQRNFEKPFFKRTQKDIAGECIR